MRLLPLVCASLLLVTLSVDAIPLKNNVQYDDVVPEEDFAPEVATVQAAAASNPLNDAIITTSNGDVDTPPPFDTSDASTDASGQYYLGGGRRRIGAGFHKSPPDPFHQDRAYTALPINPPPLAPRPTAEPTEASTTLKRKEGSACLAVGGCADDDCFIKEQSKGRFDSCTAAITDEGNSVCESSNTGVSPTAALVIEACPLSCGSCEAPKTPTPSTSPPTAPPTDEETTPTPVPTAVQAVPAGTHCYLYGNELNSTDLGPCPSVKALVGGYDVDVNADQCSTVPERARDIVGEVASIFGDSETENVLSLIASSTDSHYGSYPAYPTDDTISVGDLDNFKESVEIVQASIKAAEQAEADAKAKAKAAEEAKESGNLEEAARLEKEAKAAQATAAKKQAAADAAKEKAKELYAQLQAKVEAESKKIVIDKQPVVQRLPQGHFNETAEEKRKAAEEANEKTVEEIREATGITKEDSEAASSSGASAGATRTSTGITKEDSEAASAGTTRIPVITGSGKGAYYTFRGTPLDGNTLCCPPGWLKYDHGSGCKND